MIKLTIRVLVLVLACFAPTALAVKSIEVQALFKGRALVLLDGKRRMLKVGETSPEGVKLLSANSKGAKIEVNGQSRSIGLGRRIGGNFSGPRQQQIRVIADAQGMYIANGSINGVGVQFILDTGATLVSLNEPTARRIGLDYKRLGKAGMSITASGRAPIWRMKVHRVRLGEIVLTNVDTAVHQGEFPPVVLLGNSFLSRVEMTRAGGAVLLKRNF